MFAYEYALETSLSILCSINSWFDPDIPFVLHRKQQGKGGIFVGHGEAERLFWALDGEMAAALATEDDVAASDLAFSLDQDVALTVDLVRSGGCLLLDGLRVPIARLSHDYLEAGDRIVPLDRAVVTLGADAPPTIHKDVLLGRLRRMARARAWVGVGLARGAEVSGRVERATPDHLVVRARESVGVPLREIVYVRRVRGGSADAP